MLETALTMAAAYLIALPIAYDREARSRSAGLRTFPLVGIGSCGFVLIALQSPGVDESAVGRIVQGLITGIGFIRGGAILKDKGEVRGTATAASIWITAGIGAAVAFGLYPIAIALSAATTLTFWLITPIKQQIPQPDESQLD